VSKRRVFIDVDVQHDFCDPSGALFVHGSPNDAFRALTRHAVDRGIPIVGSVDSHAWDAWEFASSKTLGPDGQKPGFPDHCVKGTAGWLKVPGTLPPRFRFAPNVSPPSGDSPISFIAEELASGATQGLYFEKEVYSLFANPLAEGFVQGLCARLGEVELVVYGVATDYCVKAAALGLRERGFDVTLLGDAIAGIAEAGVRASLDEMAAAGVKLSTVAEALR
jgi:nicotinamidase/pyrazinamidase